VVGAFTADPVDLDHGEVQEDWVLDTRVIKILKAVKISKAAKILKEIILLKAFKALKAVGPPTEGGKVKPDSQNSKVKVNGAAMVEIQNLRMAKEFRAVKRHNMEENPPEGGIQKTDLI
jgi:hypothetical protein